MYLSYCRNGTDRHESVCRPLRSESLSFQVCTHVPAFSCQVHFQGFYFAGLCVLSCSTSVCETIRGQCAIYCAAFAEIGATAKAPAEKTMKWGIGMGYIIILSAYLTVSITGMTPCSGLSDV